MKTARHNTLSLDRVRRRSPVSEDEVHRAVAKYLDLVLAPEATYTTVPGGHRAMTIAPGYRAGFPDIIIIARGQAFCIELKRPGKTAEPHQRVVHETLRRCGAPVAVCTSIEEVAGTLDGWRIPTKGRVAV